MSLLAAYRRARRTWLQARLMLSSPARVAWTVGCLSAGALVGMLAMAWALAGRAVARVRGR